MKDKQKQRFDEWENNQRKKMGDAAFLDKYITAFQKRDKVAKVLFVLTTILMFAQFVFRAIVFIDTPIFNNLLFAVVCFALFVSWVLLTSMYFMYLSDCMCLDYVRRWNEERQALGKAIDGKTK